MDKNRIFTVGHSNQTLESFFSLLKQHEIEVLVDVRSQPYSKYTPHFDLKNLRPAITQAGIKYIFLGTELGGMPENDGFYDDKGHVLYSRLAESPLFRDGLARLVTGIHQYRVVIMCSEEDPRECHRRLLLGRKLEEREILVSHIRGDGSLQSEADLIKEEEESGKNQLQMALFEVPKEKEWKSIRPVLRRKQPPSSSED